MSTVNQVIHNALHSATTIRIDTAPSVVSASHIKTKPTALAGMRGLESISNRLPSSTTHVAAHVPAQELTPVKLSIAPQSGVGSTPSWLRKTGEDVLSFLTGTKEARADAVFVDPSRLDLTQSKQVIPQKQPVPLAKETRAYLGTDPLTRDRFESPELAKDISNYLYSQKGEAVRVKLDNATQKFHERASKVMKELVITGDLKQDNKNVIRALKTLDALGEETIGSVNTGFLIVYPRQRDAVDQSRNKLLKYLDEQHNLKYVEEDSPYENKTRQLYKLTPENVKDNQEKLGYVGLPAEELNKLSDSTLVELYLHGKFGSARYYSEKQSVNALDIFNLEKARTVAYTRLPNGVKAAEARVQELKQKLNAMAPEAPAHVKKDALLRIKAAEEGLQIGLER